MQRGLSLVLVTLVCGVARADEPPKPTVPPAALPAVPAPSVKPAPQPTPERAADAVLTVATAKDDASLRTLAAKDDPDPWLVADELVRRGEFDTAESFARAAPRVDVEKLSAYVASRRGKPDEAARRARLAAASTALSAGKFDDAIDALGPQESAPIDDVVGVRLAMGQGVALARLARLEASAAAFLVAGEAAERFGWLARAAHALRESGLSAFNGSAFATARDAWLRELSIRELRADRAGAATTLGNIGLVYDTLGDYAKALATQERALAAKEALGDRAGAATTLGNIGLVYHSLGDYTRALKTQERALSETEALGDKAGAARIVGNIGLVYQSLGDYAKALSTYERALAAKEALRDKPGAADTLGNIGGVYDGLGDTAKAIQFLERAVRAAEKLGANDLLVYALRRLASVRLKSGDAGRAISDAHRAVLSLKTLVGGLGEEQGATARGQYTGLFATGLAAAAKAEDSTEAAFFLESGRAGSLLEALESRGALRAALLPEDLRVADVQARAVEARALVAHTKAQDGGDLAAIRARDEELKAARAGVIDAVECIQREAKRAAQVVYPVAATVKDIRGFLAPGEALVLYGLVERDDIAYALLLTRGDARIVRLGKSSEIAAACEALDPTDLDADPAAALDRLRDLLVKPLGLEKDTKRLFVSPEGPLSYVPFAALVPDLEIAYEPSGTTYGVLLEEKDKRGTQVLALGDPNYTAKFDPIALDVYAPLAAAGPTRGGRLAALPGTREEAKAIGDVTLFGKEASEPSLRASLAKKKDRWHSVHFACPGLVNPDRPTLPSLALSPDGDDDGFLTALEVLKMEIPSDLVVLSACETGKGKIVGGEGIVGLTRAFMFAGSPRVICSLWKVDDEATRALMTKFYELWNPSGVNGGKPGLPTAEALKRAQEFVKSQEKWTHPYFWAAWVLWGLPS